jgi:hypothetical protein
VFEYLSKWRLPLWYTVTNWLLKSSYLYLPGSSIWNDVNITCQVLLSKNRAWQAGSCLEALNRAPVYLGKSSEENNAGSSFVKDAERTGKEEVAITRQGEGDLRTAECEPLTAAPSSLEVLENGLR